MLRYSLGVPIDSNYESIVPSNQGTSSRKRYTILCKTASTNREGNNRKSKLISPPIFIRSPESPILYIRFTFPQPSAEVCLTMPSSDHPGVRSSSVPSQPAHVFQASCAIALALQMGLSGAGKTGLWQGICHRWMLSAKAIGPS